MIEPIRRAIDVRRGPNDAFRLFTVDMGTWWPLDSHGRADEVDGRAPAAVVFEERVGGRIYEVFADGSEAEWGVVTAWDPPRRVAFDWNPSLEDRPYTQVEVTFSPAGDGTRVELVHAGWERLGDAGADHRARYEPGWGHVFDERFGAAAGRAEEPRRTA